MSILISIAMLMGAADETAQSQESTFDHEAAQQAVLKEFAAEMAARNAAEHQAQRLAAAAVLKQAAQQRAEEQADDDASAETAEENTAPVPVEEREEGREEEVELVPDELDELDTDEFDRQFSCAGPVGPQHDDEPSGEFVNAPTNNASSDFHISIDAESFRPDWIDQPLVKSGDVHTLSVTGEPRLTEYEAREALDAAVLSVVRSYVYEQIGHVDAGRKVHITHDDVERFRLVKMQYHEDYEASVGQMELRHALLEFRPDFRQEVEKRWKEHLVTTRLMRTALTVVGVMALLIITFGLLKSSARS